MTDFKKYTPWIPTDNGKTVTRFEYGFVCLGDNPAPYFSITGEEWKRAKGSGVEPAGNDCISCGCLHDSPGMPAYLKPALFFHLFDMEQGPVHYEANALYWLEQMANERESSFPDDPHSLFAAFKTTVAWGALTTDVDQGWVFESLRRVGKETRKAWLADRLPLLKERFLQVLEGLDMLDLMSQADQFQRARLNERAKAREFYTKRDC